MRMARRNGHRGHAAKTLTSTWRRFRSMVATAGLGSESETPAPWGRGHSQLKQ